MNRDIQEPSVEEQIKMETAELEKRNLDLNQMLQNKEYEIKELRCALENQRKSFEHTIAELCLKVFNKWKERL